MTVSPRVSKNGAIAHYVMESCSDAQNVTPFLQVDLITEAVQCCLSHSPTTGLLSRCVCFLLLNLLTSWYYY